MELFPSDIYEKLEFDKVIELLEKQCLGSAAIELIQNLEIHTNAVTIRRLLQEVHEYVQTSVHNHKFPIRNYQAIQEELRMLDIQGYVLPEEGLVKINVILRATGDIFKFFRKKKELYPALYDVIRTVQYDEDLSKAIMRVIDKKGEIRPNASPELMRIRKMMISKQKELDRRFKEVIKQYNSQGWLADNIESFRNGRRVLAVPSEHKRKIRGIIHDESTTGRTAYLEPEPIIEINNDLFDLETEERREIYRILRDLSEAIRPYTPQLRQYEAIMVRYDVIQAKASLAHKMRANLPKVEDRPMIGFKKAYHPLLYLKNKEENKKTVPFSLTFTHDNRILVLSGPNAGGKSISMKSVGLLQLMVQAGMLIPAKSESKVGVFKKFFVDIGDQQSLEDDLSTYSSRLRNAKYFIEEADENTLILIDEFGSGTDPKIGGSIAEAILRDLNYKNIHGVITTHYSVLKVFAFKNKGILNGSMTFDKDTFSPTYQMKVGRPGSSYAFEIAQKSGLPKKVLNYAKKKVGKNDKAVDQLLLDLQREKQEVDDLLLKMIEKEKKLDKLIQTYERMEKDYEYKRKKLKLDLKQSALQQNVHETKDIERVIREIREAQNLEKAKELAKQKRKEKEALKEKVEVLTEEVYYKPTAKKAVKADEIKVGDYVKLRTGGDTARVESINKNTAIIVVGMMRMTVKLRDLQNANTPLEINATKGIQMEMSRPTAEFENKLDIRGMYREEAIRLVESFVDEALITSASNLRIIHGKGNGVLRKAVRKKLREYKDIKDVYFESAQQGGDGVTVIEL